MSPSQASTWNEKTNQAPHTLGLSVGNVTGPTYSYSVFSFLELNGMIDAQWLLDDRSGEDDTKTISALVGATATIPLTDVIHFRPLGVNVGFLHTQRIGSLNSSTDFYSYFPMLGFGFSKGDVEFILTPSVTWQRYSDDSIFDIRLFTGVFRLRL